MIFPNETLSVGVIGTPEIHSDAKYPLMVPLIVVRAPLISLPTSFAMPKSATLAHSLLSKSMVILRL